MCEVKNCSSSSARLNRPLLGMALNICIELGSGELALELVGFELDDIDTVRGKAAKCLVESRGNVADAKSETGDDRRILGLGIVGIGGQHDEPRGVVGLIVLDVVPLRTSRP